MLTYGLQMHTFAHAHSCSPTHKTYIHIACTHTHSASLALISLAVISDSTSVYPCQLYELRMEVLGPGDMDGPVAPFSGLPKPWSLHP